MRYFISTLVFCLAVLVTLDAYGSENSAALTNTSIAKTTPDETLEAELLQLNARLQLLEEDLLYPASSRVAVYLSMDLGKLFALDAVTLKLNGKDVRFVPYIKAVYKNSMSEMRSRA
jgi:hypothetical protein